MAGVGVGARNRRQTSAIGSLSPKPAIIESTGYESVLTAQ